MYSFVTLFDKNYLTRGITLYKSMERNFRSEFTLYVLALDDVAESILRSLNFKNIVVENLNGLKEFYPVLETLQKERSHRSFSWTLSSFSIQYIVKKYSPDSITYVDADVCFFDDPCFVFDELKTESVLITPHNYTPCYDQSATSGRYCVQFMYFKNNADGNKVLEWWRNECEKCCYDVPTDGKFGDQKYLDDWLSRFPGIVYECNHPGFGLAPWNVQKYDVVKSEDGHFKITDKITRQKFNLYFYHFHSLRECECNGKFAWNLCSYDLEQNVVELLYKKYITELINTKTEYNIPYPNEYQKIESKHGVSKVSCFKQSIKQSVKFFIKSFLIWRTYSQIKKEREKNINMTISKNLLEVDANGNV